MPKSVQRCVTILSNSSKVLSSSRNSIRSRADILPSLCWRSRRSAPPPASARESRRLSSSSLCSRFIGGNYRRAISIQHSRMSTQHSAVSSQSLDLEENDEAVIKDSVPLQICGHWSDKNATGLNAECCLLNATHAPNGRSPLPSKERQNIVASRPLPAVVRAESSEWEWRAVVQEC